MHQRNQDNNRTRKVKVCIALWSDWFASSYVETLSQAREEFERAEPLKIRVVWRAKPSHDLEGFVKIALNFRVTNLNLK